jgi:hypothetical protein
MPSFGFLIHTLFGKVERLQWDRETVSTVS